MSDSDRHINFKLMRDHILATQDGKDSRTGKQYWRSLEELAAVAKQTEFELPSLDEERVAAAGLRKLEGNHLTLYTDLPPSPEVDELPHVFDEAVPLWRIYFAANIPVMHPSNDPARDFPAP